MKVKTFSTIGTPILAISIIALSTGLYCKCFRYAKSCICKHARLTFLPVNEAHIELQQILDPLPDISDQVSPQILQYILKASGVDFSKFEHYKLCIKDILKNRTYNFSVETSFYQFSNMASSGLKNECGMNEVTYRRLYPTGASSPKFYGLPKVYKQGMPLRPIVSSIGAVTYQTAKELSKILKPLVGKSPHHVHNNEDILQHLKGIQLGPDEVIISYEVKALFTSVCIQPALTIIEKLLEEDPGLQERTSMTVKNIICLLEFCLGSTYFTFQNQYYEQVEGAAMGFPSAQLWQNCTWSFETRAISTSPHPPLMWKRFVGDTCVIIKGAHKQEFLEHINSIDPHIQFTSEDSKADGSMPFLDMLITPTENGRLTTTVYRKPTHTDMYLKWDSHHPISEKYSVVGTLHHRAKQSVPAQTCYKEKRNTYQEF